MKAKHAGRNNPYKSKKKASYKKMFLGTDVRTVTQLVELKCSPKRKLVIAKQLRACAEKFALEEVGHPVRYELAKSAVRDWKNMVKTLQREIREKNIERSKVHRHFEGLWAHPAVQK